MWKFENVLLSLDIGERIKDTYITEDMSPDESHAIDIRCPMMGIVEGYVGGSLHSAWCCEERFDKGRAQRHMRETSKANPVKSLP